MSRLEDRAALFKRQSHAFQHRLLSPAPVDVAACPICLELIAETDVVGERITIEDAPPRQRTRFGLNRRVCLTCKRCNGANGYEARAGRHRKEVSNLREGLVGAVPGVVDGTKQFVKVSAAGGKLAPIGIPNEPCLVGVSIALPWETQLTEVRAAFLIAFGVLGYQWAASPALDAIRCGLRDGVESVGREVRTWKSHDPNPELANSVLVAEQAGVIAVIGPDARFGVMLPLTPDSSRGASMKISGYGLPWLEDRWWVGGDARPFAWDCAPPPGSPAVQFNVDLYDEA